jgi:hypothetical protein
MDRITPQQARQRIAIVEARLRNATPIHRGRQWELYRSNDGFYVIRYREATRTCYVGVAPDGEVRDMAGYPVDGGDIQIATSTLQSAGLGHMAQRVISWPSRQQR